MEFGGAVLVGLKVDDVRVYFFAIGGRDVSKGGKVKSFEDLVEKGAVGG